MTRHSVNSTTGRGAPTTASDPVSTPYPYIAPSASVSDELNAAYTLQNLHNAAVKTMPAASQPTSEETNDVDFLTCGNCQKEFLLSSIVDFMRHKKLDCRDNSFTGNSTDLYRRLMCQIRNCQQKFATAWGLLQHVQYSHALNIFLSANSTYGQGIENVQVTQAQDAERNTTTLDVGTLLSLSDTFQDLPLRQDVRQSVETQTDKGQEQECDDPCEDFCSPEICSIRKCCDTQNCCITIMPGTHERPKKCCASVVPKKRKQHMEQHMNANGSASRTRRRKSGETREIFIDFSAPMDNSSSNSLPAQSQIYSQGQLNVQTSNNNNGNNGFIQVEGTNMFVRNSDSNMTFSVDNQSAHSFSTQEFTLPDPFQSLMMEDLALDLPDTAQTSKDEKKKRYPTSKPFKCDHCGMAFNQRIHLKKHLSKHTGIKPFKCGQCNYSTVERSHLKVHIRIHTGEKPFKCGFCEYATAQNSTLKIHLKRHHSGMTLSCTICGKNFEQPKQLNQHKQEHEPISDSDQKNGKS